MREPNKASDFLTRVFSLHRFANLVKPQKPKRGNKVIRWKGKMHWDDRLVTHSFNSRFSFPKKNRAKRFKDSTPLRCQTKELTEEFFLWDFNPPSITSRDPKANLVGIYIHTWTESTGTGIDQLKRRYSSNQNKNVWLAITGFWYKKSPSSRPHSTSRDTQP